MQTQTAQTRGTYAARHARRVHDVVDAAGLTAGLAYWAAAAAIEETVRRAVTDPSDVDAIARQFVNAAREVA